MPFITVRMNRRLGRERENKLKTRINEAISLIPGMSEQSLLLAIEDNCPIYLRGEGDSPTAYVERSVFGNERHGGYVRLTAALSYIFREVAGVSPECFCIRYSDIRAWGVADRTFDRKDFC